MHRPALSQNNSSTACSYSTWSLARAPVIFPEKQFSYHRRSGVRNAAPGLVEPHLGGHVLQVDAAGLGVGLGGPPDEEEPVDPEEPLPEPDKRKQVFKKGPKLF